MSLLTPDFGLVFWMVVIFGIVLFILAKWGFPVITSMVDKRSRAIEESLRNAEAIEKRMKEVASEHEAILDDARKQQAAMLAEAAETAHKIVEDAKVQATHEAEAILSDAEKELARKKDEVLGSIREEVALVSVAVAEKILRHNLQDNAQQKAYMDKLVDEVAAKTKDIS